MFKKFRAVILASLFFVYPFAISPLAPTANAAVSEQPCSQQSWGEEDDTAHEMSLSYNLPLGDTTYSNTYVTTNGTLTFGSPDPTFSSYPNTPSISLAGYDWVTWNGGYLSYGVTDTGFCVEWKVRPFPQSEGDFTTIKLTVDTSRLPTWSGIVETTGWLPSDLRRGIRFQSGEEVVQISEAFTINGGRPVEMQTCWDGTIIPMSGTCPPEPPPGQCWDGSTVAYNETCPPIPPDTQCWDGTWVAWSQTCPPEPQPITCWDGSVIPGNQNCPAEPQVTCWDGSTVRYQSDCSPTPPPITCWDGSSVNWDQTCPQTPPPIECWDGSSVNWDEQCPPAPTSIVVSSLLDDGSQGTLRWAITQANAQNGGIYDSITFSVEGVISLTSNLPNIVGQLTISGQDKVSLFGNYRLYASTGSNVTINDLEFNSTYLENERGTLTINSSYFHNSGRSIFNKNGNTTITYVNNTLFTNNVTAIASDWGGTPSIFSVSDSSYDNRIYVNSSTFENNSTAISVERTVIVNNSQFNNNRVALNGRGINKHSVIDSTFSGNSIAIQTFSWLPTSWLTFFSNSSIENNNRLIKRNTFTNNSYAIVLNDSYNNGQRTQQGATVRDNSWDESGFWISWSQWDGIQNVESNENTLDENQYPFYSLNNISIAPPPIECWNGSTIKWNQTCPTEPIAEITPEPIPSPSQAPIDSPALVPSESLIPDPIPDLALPIEPLPIDVPEILELPLTSAPIIESDPELIIEPLEYVIDSAFTDGIITEEETQAVINNLLSDGYLSTDEVADLLENLQSDGALSQEEKELLSDILVEAYEDSAVPFDVFEESGLDYEDLPPDQPITLENGVVITAEIADAIEIFEDSAELLATILTDPSKALKALANVGADLTPEKREEAQTVVISAIVVTQIAAFTGFSGIPVGGTTPSGGAGVPAGSERVKTPKKRVIKKTPRYRKLR